jgi:hypothetical protein
MALNTIAPQPRLATMRAVVRRNRSPGARCARPDQARSACLSGAARARHLQCMAGSVQ